MTTLILQPMNLTKERLPMNDFKEFLESTKKQKKELEKRIQSKGQALLKGMFKEFFHKHPEAKAIGWTQYTPYWNDGEECDFSVNIPILVAHSNAIQNDVLKLLRLKAWTENDVPDDEPYEDESIFDNEDACVSVILGMLDSSNEYETSCNGESLDEAGVARRALTRQEKSLIKDFEGLRKLIYKSDDLLKECFGDHVRVKATQEGFEVSEFNHN